MAGRCKVIGAGLPRTGTNSLEEALSILGYRTHHMKTLANSDMCDLWHDYIVDGKPADWKGMFKDYDACCDNPACVYWEEIAKEFPEAKVVLTVRKAEGWAKSYQTLQGFMAKLEWVFAIFRFIGIQKFARFFKVAAGNKRNFWAKVYPALLKAPIPRLVSDVPTPSTKELIDFYPTWTEDVQKKCPKEKLLTFDVRDGWEPLCKFLDKPVPNVPFPNSNAGTSGLRTVAIESFIIQPIKRILGMKDAK